MSDKINPQDYLPSGFNGMSFPERIQFFRENSDRVEEQTNVIKELSEEEKLDCKDQLAEESLRLRKLEEEKKTTVSTYNDSIKAVKSAIKPLLNSLETGFESVIDDKFWLFDQEEGKAFAFTSDGACVDERRLRPDERQVRMKTIGLGGKGGE